MSRELSPQEQYYADAIAETIAKRQTCLTQESVSKVRDGLNNNEVKVLDHNTQSAPTIKRRFFLF